jgi:serine/threonine protein kinase
VIASDKFFIAPEIINGYAPSSETDAWELAATIKYLIGTTKISTELQDLLNKMMHPNDKERITMKKALAHVWFSSTLRGSSNNITFGYINKNKVRINKAVLSLVNAMAIRGKTLNTNEFRNTMQIMDQRYTGEIAFSLFVTYTIDKESLVINAPDVGGEFLVNYNDILCSCMSLAQFISFERRSELFIVIYAVIRVKSRNQEGSGWQFPYKH